MGPGPAPRLPLGFTLGGALLQAVLQGAQLPPGAQGGQCAPAVVPHPGRQGELWREEGVDGQRLGGVGKRREAAGVVLLVVLLLVLLVLVLVGLHQRHMVARRGQLLEAAVMFLLAEVVRGRGHEVAAWLELGGLRRTQQVVAGRQVDLMEAGRVEVVTGGGRRQRVARGRGSQLVAR